MEKKYQIFISSTYEDLKTARKKVQDAILSMYHFPVGMELFGAADEDQWEIIKETIDSSDYYVLIIAHRYGSIIQDGPDAGISYTEKEFRYAKEKNIPILAFIINDNAQVMPSSIDKEPEKVEKLAKFKDEAKSGRMVDWWLNEDELASKVTASLYKEFNRKKRPGWIRGDAVDIEKSLQEIVILNSRVRQLEDENRILKSQALHRIPNLSVGINGNSKWTVSFKDIERPDYILSNYMPLSYKDAKLLGVSKVTKEQIDQYNAALPPEESIQEYIDELLLYKYKKEANVNFGFYIENCGTCKANDINVRITFPEEILILERDAVKKIMEPEAPCKPKNPIEESIRKTVFGGTLGYWDETPRIPSFEPSLLVHSISPVNSRYKEKIDGNTIIIEIADLLHTYCRHYEKYCIVPLKRGIFQVECEIMCEEFLEPTVQKITIEVI